jgi:hypothetical protein
MKGSLLVQEKSDPTSRCAFKVIERHGLTEIFNTNR